MLPHVAQNDPAVLRDAPGDPMRVAMRQMAGVFAELDRGVLPPGALVPELEPAHAGGGPGHAPGKDLRDRARSPGGRPGWGFYAAATHLAMRAGWSSTLSTMTLRAGSGLLGWRSLGH
jgi:hypothetical protein